MLIIRSAKLTSLASRVVEQRTQLGTSDGTPGGSDSVSSSFKNSEIGDKIDNSVKNSTNERKTQSRRFCQCSKTIVNKSTFNNNNNNNRNSESSDSSICKHSTNSQLFDSLAKNDAKIKSKVIINKCTEGVQDALNESVDESVSVHLIDTVVNHNAGANVNNLATPRNENSNNSNSKEVNKRCIDIIDLFEAFVINADLNDICCCHSKFDKSRKERVVSKKEESDEDCSSAKNSAEDAGQNANIESFFVNEKLDVPQSTRLDNASSESKCSEEVGLDPESLHVNSEEESRGDNERSNEDCQCPRDDFAFERRSPSVQETKVPQANEHCRVSYHRSKSLDESLAPKSEKQDNNASHSEESICSKLLKNMENGKKSTERLNNTKSRTRLDGCYHNECNASCSNANDVDQKSFPLKSADKSNGNKTEASWHKCTKSGSISSDDKHHSNLSRCSSHSSNNRVSFSLKSLDDLAASKCGSGSSWHQKADSGSSDKCQASQKSNNQNNILPLVNSINNNNPYVSTDLKSLDDLESERNSVGTSWFPSPGANATGSQTEVDCNIEARPRNVFKDSSCERTSEVVECQEPRFEYRDMLDRMDQKFQILQDQINALAVDLSKTSSTHESRTRRSASSVGTIDDRPPLAFSTPKAQPRNVTENKQGEIATTTTTTDEQNTINEREESKQQDSLLTSNKSKTSFKIDSPKRSLIPCPVKKYSSQDLRSKSLNCPKSKSLDLHCKRPANANCETAKPLSKTVGEEDLCKTREKDKNECEPRDKTEERIKTCQMQDSTRGNPEINKTSQNRSVVNKSKENDEAKCREIDRERPLQRQSKGTEALEDERTKYVNLPYPNIIGSNNIRDDNEQRFKNAENQTVDNSTNQIGKEKSKSLQNQVSRVQSKSRASAKCLCNESDSSSNYTSSDSNSECDEDDDCHTVVAVFSKCRQEKSKLLINDVPFDLREKRVRQSNNNNETVQIEPLQLSSSARDSLVIPNNDSACKIVMRFDCGKRKIKKNQMGFK